jgi:outer membrane receptor protein involved in Fe transport
MSTASRASWIILAVALLTLAARPARAQQPARGGDVSVFLPADFADSAPANAWDMLSRLPGFVAVDADEDVRGYAGARGNLLIDGARPTSKHEDAKTLLKRIPAGAVERIELIRGGVPGIDMAGYALLANVVRRHEATSQTAIEAGLLAATDGWRAPQGQWEYGRRWDGHTLDLAVKLDPELDDDTGRGHIDTFAPDGTRQQRERLDTRTTKNKGEASANWRQPLAGGQLSLNLAARGERARTDTRIDALAPDEGSERVHEDEDTDEAEAGARYVREFGERTRLELMATRHQAWLDDLERSREDGDDETFGENTRTGETIGRIDLTHAWSDALTLDGSLEGARNTLRSTTRLQQDGVDVALPGSDVGIEERRSEAAVGATWKPAPGWIFDAGLRVERSALAQTGDSPRERRFSYPKPRLSVQWDVDANDQLRLALSREVGQLDFEDFVASASLETGRVSAGNAELKPDRTWRSALTWEHQLWRDAAFTLSWTHERISDVVDRVLVVTDDDVFDAPGNIGDGRRDTLALDISLPLDGIGFHGGRLTSSMQWRRSRVTDPTTGRPRPISEEKPVEGSIELTQDLPTLRTHWGIELEHLAERKTEYRYDEIKRKSEGMGWTVFVEQELGTHWRVRAEATDLFGRGFDETREKYDGPRSTEPLEEIERRRRRSPGYVSLAFRRSTGG